MSNDTKPTALAQNADAKPVATEKMIAINMIVLPDGERTRTVKRGEPFEIDAVQAAELAADAAAIYEDKSKQAKVRAAKNSAPLPGSVKDVRDKQVAITTDKE